MYELYYVTVLYLVLFKQPHLTLPLIFLVGTNLQLNFLKAIGLRLTGLEPILIKIHIHKNLIYL